MKNVSNNVRNTTYSIELRSKFVKQLSKLPEATQEKIKQVINSFVKSDDHDTCFEILWKLTADPASGLKPLGLRVDSDATVYGESCKLTTYCIPSGLVQPLRNELRYQRKQVYPAFMELDVPESCKAAFKNLSQATNDGIIMVAAYEHCELFCQTASNKDFERVQYLLNSPKEGNFFGGIRSLHFGRAEAMCLKNYAAELSQLLEVLRKETLAASQEVPPQTPMAAQLDAWRLAHPEAICNEDESLNSIEKIEDSEASDIAEEGTEISESVISDEVSSSEEGKQHMEKFRRFKPITATTIVENSELFQNFLESYGKILENGFDPWEVIASKEAISMISEAAKLLKSK